jgi:hypothetical protein
MRTSCCAALTTGQCHDCPFTAPMRPNHHSTDPAVDPMWRNGYAAGFEAGRASAPKFDPGWGKPCAKCGEPVYAPTTRYQKATFAFGDQIWHGHCIPEGPITGTFKITG